MSLPVPLENDPRNPCIGCGPEHPFGLRLAFERDGDAVRTRLLADSRYQGAPDRLHSAILYLAMTETANWTVFGLLDRVGLPTRTSALAARRFVRVGETIAIVGRRAPGEPLVVMVEALDEAGELVATLERAFDVPSREEFARRLGYPDAPAAYGDAFPA